MGFRDDREAMRAHIEALKAKIDQREGVEEGLQAQIDELRERVDALAAADEKRSASPAKPARASATRGPRDWRPVAVAAVVGVAAVGLFSGLVLLTGEGTLEPEDPVEPETVGEPTPAATPEPPSEPTSWPEPAPAVEPPSSAVRPNRGPHVAVWEGAVASADGVDLTPATRCTITSVGGVSYLLPPDELRVACGDRVLYERTDETAEPSALERWECQVRGQPDPEGGLYAVHCLDRGVHPDRPELELDTLEQRARIWTDDFEVSIALAHAAAFAPDDRPLRYRSTLPLRAGAERSGVVGDAGGPLEARAACELSVTPIEHPPWARHADNCRVSLTCGGEPLLRRHEAACQVDRDLALQGVTIQGHDEPLVLEADFPIVRVASIAPERTWHATIDLAPEGP